MGCIIEVLMLTALAVKTIRDTLKILIMFTIRSFEFEWGLLWYHLWYLGVDALKPWCIFISVSHSGPLQIAISITRTGSRVQGLENRDPKNHNLIDVDKTPWPTLIKPWPTWKTVTRSENRDLLGKNDDPFRKTVTQFEKPWPIWKTMTQFEKPWRNLKNHDPIWKTVRYVPPYTSFYKNQ